METALKTMLIADDSRTNRRLIMRIFEGQFEFLEAADGGEALELLEARGGDIDVVVLDLIMPVRDGYFVLEKLKRNPDPAICDIPAIVITAEGNAESELRALDLGASELIRKPFDPRVVTRRVQNIMSRRELERMTAHVRELENAQHNDIISMLTSSISGVIKMSLFDEGNTLVYINGSIQELLGYTPEEFIQSCGGKYSNAVYKEDARAASDSCIKQIMETGRYRGEYRLVKKDGSLVWVQDAGRRFTDREGRDCINSVITDITPLKEAMEQLRVRAEIDELTGIFNGETFYRETEKLLHEQKGGAFLLVRWDIDRFKLINDLFGKETGDALLKELSRSFMERLPGKGTFGRLDADNFVTCMPAAMFNENALEGFAENYLRERSINYTIVLRMGVFEIDDVNLPVDQMCDRANLALLTTKGNYFKRCAWYDSGLRDALLTEQQIITEMDKALYNGEFCIYLQPIYSATTSRPVYAEALVRWEHPERGTLMPGTFIPLFERNGFITKLDTYVWESACRFISQAREKGCDATPISVNLSRMDFYNPDICNIYIEIAQRYHVEPTMLKIEITESAYNDNPRQLLEVMRRFQHYGFQVLMDDFGSGYSSLNMLKDVPVDILKIDMKFASELESSDRARSVLFSVVRMAKWLEMAVVVEGVETAEQLEFMRSIGCDLVQGFYYSKPLKQADFTEKILKGYAPAPEKQAKLPYSYMESIWNTDKGVMFIMDNLMPAFAIYEYTGGQLELVRVTARYYQLTGSSPSTLIRDTKDARSWILEKDRAPLMEALKKAHDSGQTQHIELDRYHQSGRIMHLASDIHCIGDLSGSELYCASLSELPPAPPAGGGVLEKLAGLYGYVMLMDYEKGSARLLHYQGKSDKLNTDVPIARVLTEMAASVPEERRQEFMSMLSGEAPKTRFRRDGGKICWIKSEIIVNGSLRTVLLYSLRIAKGQYLFCLRHCDMAEEALIPAAEAEAASSARPVILVVDDNHVNRMILRKMLSASYDIVEAENGRQALTLLYSSKRISLVLLDIVMPVMDGFEFLTERAANPDIFAIPVIALSQSETRNDELRALELGANDFMRKPYEALMIKQRISNLISMQTAVAGRKSIEALVNGLPGGVAVYEEADGRLRFKYINEGLARLRGYTPDEYTERFAGDWLGVVHPEDRPRMREQLLLAAEASACVSAQYRSLHRNGDVVSMRMQSSFISQSGRVRTYFALFSDITDVERMSGELASAHAKLRIAFEQTDLEMWEYDIPKKRMRFARRCNENARLGMSIDDIPGSLLEKKAVQPEYYDFFARNLARVDAGESPVEFDVPLLKGDKYTWRRVKYTTLFAPDGRPASAIGVAQDISAEIDAKHRYELEAGYRRSVMADALAFLELDVESGRIVDFACAFQLPEEPSGDGLEQLLLECAHPDDVSALQKLTNVAGHTSPEKDRRLQFRLSPPGSNDYIWASLTVRYVKTPEGKLRAFFDIADINEQKKRELHMLDRAQRDLLTGVFNRVSFEELTSAALSSGRQAAFIILDIDDFKDVNDLNGHAYGDEVLKEAALRLQRLFRESDLIARMGGDEFAVLLTGVSREEALERAEKICSMFSGWNAGAGNGVSCSAGVALSPGHGQDFDTLYHNADVALYRAKHDGKKRCRLYDEADAYSGYSQWRSRDWLVDTMDEMVFVSDAVTHELLYANTAGLAFAKGKPGDKCHKALHGLDAPCPFCPAGKLTYDSFYSWTMFNEAAGRHYLTKDKLITWQGRPAHLQIATDITEELERIIMRRMALEKAGAEQSAGKFLDYMDFMPFDYDIKKDVMRYVVRHSDGTSGQARIENFTRALGEGGLIHPDYKQGFRDGLKNAARALTRGSFKYKADYLYSGVYTSYRADYFSTGSKAEGVTHIVGRVQRVESEAETLSRSDTPHADGSSTHVDEASTHADGNPTLADNDLTRVDKSPAAGKESKADIKSEQPRKAEAPTFAESGSAHTNVELTLDEKAAPHTEGV